MKRLTIIALAVWISTAWHSDLRAQAAPPKDICHSFTPGSPVPEPEDLRSVNGELTVDLRIHNYVEANGSVRYCYITKDGKESPNLRLNPGDLLILNLKNDLTDTRTGTSAPAHHHAMGVGNKKADPCVSGLMSATSTNLHFHGLTIPPV